MLAVCSTLQAVDCTLHSGWGRSPHNWQGVDTWAKYGVPEATRLSVFSLVFFHDVVVLSALWKTSKIPFW